MIHDTMVRDSVTGNLFRMYENGVAVGAGGSGTNADRASNQLVQFFLRAFYRNHHELLPRGPKGSTGFLLDGKVGDQTITGIRKFQEYMKKHATPIIVDSRVSVPKGDLVPGAYSRWTIHILNNYYKQHARTKEDYHHLWLNTEILHEAPELAAELASKQSR